MKSDTLVFFLGSSKRSFSTFRLGDKYLFDKFQAYLLVKQSPENFHSKNKMGNTPNKGGVEGEPNFEGSIQSNMLKMLKDDVFKKVGQHWEG